MTPRITCILIIFAAVAAYTIAWRFLPDKLTGPKVSEISGIERRL